MFGLLNLYKPSGPTSRDCVNKVQRLVRPVKVGHAGTLDPIASGVLLVLVGNATRLTDEFHLQNKEYVGTFRLGVMSPSADTETELTLVPELAPVTRAMIEQALSTFQGEIEQTPPIYSAIRIDGKRAHQLARGGETFEVPSRRVLIEEAELLHFSYPEFRIRIVCSTGTYIRSIGRDVARAVGSDAVMTDLIRTRIGNQTIENCCRMEDLDSLQSIAERLRPPQEGLTVLPSVNLPTNLIDRFRYGQKVPVDQMPFAVDHSQLMAIDSENRLCAILTRVDEDGIWRTAKFFQHENGI